jgi:hypothetical protein
MGEQVTLTWMTLDVPNARSFFFWTSSAVDEAMLQQLVSAQGRQVWQTMSLNQRKIKLSINCARVMGVEHVGHVGEPLVA